MSFRVGLVRGGRMLFKLNTRKYAERIKFKRNNFDIYFKLVHIAKTYQYSAEPIKFRNRKTTILCLFEMQGMCTAVIY